MAAKSMNVTEQDGVSVVKFGSDYAYIDERVLDDVQKFLLDTADRAEPPKLLLNLADTEFFGSAFIEVIFRAWNRLKARNGRLGLCELTPYCAEVIDITHLDRVWTITRTQDEAIAALNGESADSPDTD